MADPVDPATLEALERASATLDTVANRLDNVTTKMGDLFSRLATEGGDQVQKLGNSFKHTRDQVGQVNTALQTTKTNIQSIDVSGLSGNFSNLLRAGESAFMGIAKSASIAATSATQDTNKVVEGLSSLAAIGAAGIRIKAFDMPILKQIAEAQSFMMPLQKAALQTGIAFGDSFDKANSHVNAFMGAIQDSITVTQENADVVSGVAASLGQAFGATGATTNITNLHKAINASHGALNLMNVALLTSKATGTDAATITGVLNQAHLELGEGIDGAAVALGRIGQAAENSGLGYKAVSDSIIQSTSALKMFGGTVGSVAPLFEKFSNSLQEGRKGLAPELLQRFAGGLERMGFETRALLGIQAPGGAGRGGAIGAGLEMEAALEQGPAGMQKIMDNLTTTLERFGGGKIVGRQEAIEDPTLQRNFMIQRQLLQNMMGLDTASANKTLEMLKEVQQTGLKAGQGQEEKLAELIGSGQQVAEDTTSNQVKAINNFQATLIPAVEEISSLLREGMAGTAIAKLMSNFDEAMKNMAKSGKFDFKEFSNTLLRTFSGDETRTADMSLQMFGGLEGMVRQLAVKGREQFESNRPERRTRAETRETRGARRAVETASAPGRQVTVPVEAISEERRKQILAERNVAAPQRLPTPAPARPERPQLPTQMARVPEPRLEAETREPLNIESIGDAIRRDIDSRTRVTPRPQPAQLAPAPPGRARPEPVQPPTAQPLPALIDTTGQDITAALVGKTLKQVGAELPEANVREQIEMARARPQPILSPPPEEMITRAETRRPRLEPPTGSATEVVRREKQETAATAVAATQAPTVAPAPVTQAVTFDITLRPRVVGGNVEFEAFARRVMSDTIKVNTNT